MTDEKINPTTRLTRFDDYPLLSAFDIFLGDRRIDMQRGEIFVRDL